MIFIYQIVLYIQFINYNKNKKMKQNSIISTVNDLINKTEANIKKLKLLVKKLENWETEISEEDEVKIFSDLNKLNKPVSNDDDIIVEGIFDGNNMIWSDGNKYTIPLNYSSKSKIIQWDNLKLRILSDGSMIYKVILQIPRKTIKWLLTKNDEWKFVALGDDERIYSLNQAAVSFFHGKVSDECVLIIWSDKKCDYAAIEAVINIDL